METWRTITNYTLLIIVTMVSFLIIETYDIFPKQPYDSSLDLYRIASPGILFSFFIVIVQRSNYPIIRLIMYFFVLLLLYTASYLAGTFSWGIAVPFIGAAGALLIRKLFYLETELFNQAGVKYLKLGFVAGLAGLAFLVSTSDFKMGFRFGLILFTWQFAFGVLWIKQIETKEVEQRIEPLPAS